MSEISVNNQTNNKYKTAVIAGGIGAAAGGAIKGGGCYLSQKAALANPKEFIQKAEQSLDEFKKSGATDEAVGIVEDALKKSKEFIKKGKIDFKAIGKRTLAGAAVVGAIGTVIGLIASKNNKGETNQNKNIDAMA